MVRWRFSVPGRHDETYSLIDGVFGKVIKKKTGACRWGTRNFIKNELTDKKESYSIAETIDLTKGQWGHESFKSFFAANQE